MATGKRRDPLLVHNFSVSLLESSEQGESGLLGAFTSITLSTAGMKTAAGFSEISGLDASMEVEDYAAGGSNGATLKFPGRVKWANLVMKRGVIARRDLTDTSDLWSWVQSFLDGSGKRRDGVIALHDEAHDPQLVWGFRRGLPLRWNGPGMNAMQTQIAIEQIEIAHEGLYRIQSGGALGTAIRDVVDAVFG
jgi:phage tail-like protein